MQYSKILRSFFEVQCQFAKNAKIMRPENLALYDTHILFIFYSFVQMLYIENK